MKNNKPIAVLILFILLACCVFARENDICILQGLSPPCNEITLEEVINYINQRSYGNASLTDVLSLVFAWADQEETLDEKYLEAVNDAKTAEESDIY